MTTENTQTAQTTAPAYIAYHVNEAGEASYWNRIGAAWHHKDGNGYSLLLDCFPADGRITLRAASEKK